MGAMNNLNGVTPLGILIWVVVIVVPILIVVRQTQMENRAIARYAEMLRKKELKKNGKKDDQEFIFIEDGVESSINQSIEEEEREEDYLTEEAYDFVEDMM